MRWLVFLVTVFLTSTTALADFTGKVVGVTDGDTIKVMRDGRSVTIRLHGIDAPEKSQSFGSTAKRFVSNACFGQNVTVIEHDTDRYGRLVAELRLADGTNLNHAVVESGLAWWYRKYAPSDSGLESAEKNAKTARRGLWSQYNPSPPWEYRNGTSTKSKGTTTTTVRPPTTQTMFSSSARSHWLTTSSKKRHNSSCRYYRKTNGRPCGPNEGVACKLCGG